MHLRPLIAALFVALFAAVPCAFGQKLLDKSKPPTDPANDPWTRGGDPAILEALGYESMGGFEFGPAPDTSEDTA